MLIQIGATVKQLETDRLILRSWRETDLPSMVAINQDPKVCEYLPVVGNRDTTIALIDRIINSYPQDVILSHIN